MDFEINITIPPDEDGYIGRECPQPECEGYFKIINGTGIQGSDILCHCPYCGHAADSNHFWTKEQVRYIESILLNRVTEDMLQALKGMEFDEHYPSGFGISLKVTGTLSPIRYYREKQLETHIICDKCDLHYAIYGVFAYCPDCGIHNSQQILEKNLELAEKEAALADKVEGELSAHLIADALENEVSAFDGFGRETCRIHANKALYTNRAEHLSFQSLTGAQKNVQELFTYDLASGATPDQWAFALRCFQKRHLLAHKMGVADEEYIRLAADPHAILGRKVTIATEEVTTLAGILKELGASLVQHLESL